MGNGSRVASCLLNDLEVKVWTLILRQDSGSGSLEVVLKCLMNKTHFNLIYSIRNLFLVSF